jgi:hypothetical protein
MSRSFTCILIGLAMTLFSWYGPWAWPAAPAFAALHLVFGNGASWQELPYAGRGAVLVALIAINSGCWALVAASIWFVVRRSLSLRPTRSRS